MRLTSLVCLAILVALLVLCFSSIADASVSNPLDYSFVKTHSITGSSDGALTDYQIKFNIHSGSGSDNGMDVYLNNESRSWPYDIRFTDSNNVPLSYWIESNDSNSAVVWVKVDNIPAKPASASINIYYGKDNDQGASDGNSTFLLFDNFRGYSIDSNKWGVYATAGSNGLNSYAYEAGAGLCINMGTGSGASVKVTSMNSFGVNTSLEMKIRGINPWDQHVLIGYGNLPWNSTSYYPSEMAGFLEYYSADQDYTYFRTTHSGGSSNTNIILNSQDIEIKRLASKSIYYSGGAEVANHTTSLPAGNLYVGISTWCGPDSFFYSGIICDFIFVRNCTLNEPTHGTYGAGTAVHYDYMKSHVINGSSSALSDYQMKFIIHSDYGTDSGQNVYLGGHSRSWPSDIRFYDSNNTPLNYWIESYDSNNATAWVKINSIPASPGYANISLYYGRDNDSSMGSAADTFLFFDDFNNLSQWSTSGNVSISNGIATVYSTGTSSSTLTSNLQFPDNSRIRFNAKTAHIGYTKNKYYNELFISTTDINTNYGYEKADYADTSTTSANLYSWRTNGLAPTTSSIMGWSANTYHTQELIRHGIATWNVDDISANKVDSSTLNYNVNNQYLSFQTSDKNDKTTASRMDIDWISVSKYTNNEPTQGSWGVEIPVVMASFHANVTSGLHPLTVLFTEDSIGNITNRTWDFGDGNISSELNPTHTYYSPGKYTVSLTVANPPGSNTLTKTDYIWVQNKDYDADLTYINPDGVNAGNSFTLNINATNTGNLDWNDSAQISLDPTNNNSTLFGSSRYYLPAGTIVQPGQSYIFQLNLTAPTALNVYYLSYSMLQSGNVISGPVFVKIVVPDITISNKSTANGNGITVANNNGTAEMYYVETTYFGGVPHAYNDISTLTPGVDYDYAYYSPGNSSTNGFWNFVFRAGSFMTSNHNDSGQYEQTRNIFSHYIEVDNESGVGYYYGPYVDNSFAPSNGAYPGTGGSDATQAMYGEETGILLEKLVEKTLEDLPGVTYAFTGYDLADTYMRFEDDQYQRFDPSNPNFLKIGWQYTTVFLGQEVSNDTSNASNYVYWDQWAEPSQTTNINVTYGMSVEYTNTGSPGELTYDLTMTIPITINAPPPDPTLMNAQQLNQYGIEAIPTNEYIASSLAISNGSSIDTTDKKNNKYIYRISKKNLNRYIKIGPGKVTFTVKQHGDKHA